VPAEYQLDIYPPYPKQQEIEEYVLRPEPNRVKRANVRCGIAFGKSTCGIDLATKVLSIDGEQVHLFLEPDRNRMENVFLAEWHNIVPPELWDVNYGKRTIGWKPTGAKLLYWHRDIRGNKKVRANMFRGINVTSAQDDESPEGFLLEQYQNIFNRIRKPSPVRFFLTWGTPQPGEYSRAIKRPGQKLFVGTTYDNPYLPEGYIEQMIANMSSRDQVRREIYGEEVSLEGRIFREAKIDAADAEHDPENRWPRGNVHWEFTTFRPELPWWLFCDLGSATGAYIAVQKIPAMRFGGDVWIAVADYCPNDDASASRAFQKMDDTFGRPAAVVAGADVHTKNSVDGRTVAYFASQVWGNIPIRAMGESNADKMRQYDIVSRMISTLDGNRRFCIAKDFVSLAPESHRGLREMLLEYSMRPIEERAEDEFLPKGNDQPLCHVADALLMGSEVMAPPEFMKKRERIQ
jgi:hypothetical protein